LHHDTQKKVYEFRRGNRDDNYGVSSVANEPEDK